jgi:hypothetical protein
MVLHEVIHKSGIILKLDFEKAYEKKLGVGQLLVAPPPPFLLVETRRCGTHGIIPRQQPPSAWQASFNPSQPDLPTYGEVVECSVRLGRTCECYLALVEC